MIRRPATVLLLVVALLTACGPGARAKLVRASFDAAQTIQAGFEAWDQAHKTAIARNADSYEDGVRELERYYAERAPVITAIDVVYRAIAAAALGEDNASVKTALAALDRLRTELSKLSGGEL